MEPQILQPGPLATLRPAGPQRFLIYILGSGRIPMGSASRLLEEAMKRKELGFLVAQW